MILVLHIEGWSVDIIRWEMCFQLRILVTIEYGGRIDTSRGKRQILFWTWKAQITRG